MKPSITSIVISIILFCSVAISAQTDPGTANLIHHWTFDDGTANDTVSAYPVNGTLEGGATIVNQALKLSAQGQYLSFSGSALALDTFSVISQEIWYTPVAGTNTDYTMLSYFGNTSNGLGYNYISTSSARGDNISRTAISDGTYDSEVSADGPEYDDGILRQMVSVIRSDSVILYIDGEFVSKTANTVPLSAIGTDLAYLGKGGYTSDPTWIGTISKFGIYNKSLSADEVKFLFQQGAEQSPMITSSVTALSFDEFITTNTFKVSGLNLSDSITITAPAGITVSPLKLSKDTSNASVLVTYDTTTSVDGNITLTSGSAELNIPVKSYSNSCFSKLYPAITNLIADPYISSLDNFDGWGNRSINTDSEYVYCGATSGKVTGSNAGSLDVSLTGNLMTNTIYRIKAKVYAIDGPFQIGILGWSDGQADYTKSIGNTGSWQDVDFTFTTGKTLGASQRVFFNNYGLSGTTGYIDNWEMYAIPKVYTSLSSLSFLTPGSKNITVRGVNLSQEITISASAGFSVSPTTMPADVNGDILAVTYDGAETTSGFLYFTSGDVKDSIFVDGSVDPVLFTSVSLISMDEINNSANFFVTGYNLTTSVTLTAPDGITLSASTLPSTVSGTEVTVSYDGVANSSGTITLISGSATVEVNVLAVNNDECFIPLYPEATNLIVDPTCNSYTTDGWGSRSINSDTAFVYCGSRSGKVTNNGSLERDLTGIMKPNTEYRVKAKVYKKSPVKEGNMGYVTYSLDLDSASNPTAYRLISIAMDSACVYYSKYTPFIENIYVYYNAGIPTAQAGYHSSIGFGANTRYMWVGTAIHEMAHYFGSGTTAIWQSKMVNGKWTGDTGNSIIQEITNGSTQAVSGDNNDNPQHYWPYGINQKEEITGLGSISTQEKALADAARLVKAMLVDDCGLPTNNPPVGVGVYGWDASSDDIYHEDTVPNSWQDIDFTFTTGAALKAGQGVYFNTGSGYIDNWEMYEVPEVNILKEINQLTQEVYLLDNKLVTEVELSKSSHVDILIYDIQGKFVKAENYWYEAGYSKKTIDASLPEGIYIVTLVSDEFYVSKKVISY